MQTKQIVTDIAMQRDLPAMAEVDGEWDQDTILDLITAKSRTTYVARRGRQVIGYMVVEPVCEWLTILRLRVPASVVSVHRLIERAKTAVGVINSRREATGRAELAGIIMAVSEKNERGLGLLRLDGFKIHRGPLLTESDGKEWITMSWDCE